MDLAVLANQERTVQPAPNRTNNPFGGLSQALPVADGRQPRCFAGT